MSTVVVKDVKKTFILSNSSRSLKTAFIEMFQKKIPKNRQQVLNGISLEITEGEFFGIVGRNGSGKSTLLKIIAGIYQPTSGSIQVQGRLVPFIELGVGFSPDLTGQENVYLGAALLGFTKEETDQMYDEIVAFSELQPYMHKKLKNYSSGMQVRLAFSLAIRARGDILLVDEVLAVGDKSFQEKCFKYFRQLKRSDKTVIFVSHNMKAVTKYCQRAALIENGNITKIGQAKEVAQAYGDLFK